MAANKVQDQIKRVRDQALKMGSQGVENARVNRESKQVKLEAKISKESLLQKKAKDQEYANSHKLRNYVITTNLLKSKVTKRTELTKKKEALANKMAKAVENRKRILEAKIQKAKSSYAVAEIKEEEPVAVVEEKPQEEKAKVMDVIQQLDQSDEDKSDIKERLQILRNKLTKAAERKQVIELKKINKAKEMATKFGPSEELKQKWKAFKKLNAMDKNHRHSWFIQSDKVTEASDKSNSTDLKRSVFIQVDQSLERQKPWVSKNKVKNFKNKNNAIAFEIERDNQPKKVLRA